MKTYNDTFVEQIIRRKSFFSKYVVKILAVLVALALIGLAYWFFTSIFPFFFAVICILLFFAFVYTVREFEYSFINGDVDVDRIDGKRKRKSVLSINCKEIKSMAPCADGSEITGDFTEKHDFSIGPRSEGRWYFIAEREDETRILVYISPNERLLDAFKLYLGRRMDYTRRQQESEEES